MKYFIIAFVIALVLLSFFLVLFIKQKKRYKELKNLQDIELRKRFETEYNTLVKEQKEGIRRLEKEKQTLQREINEKEEFNKTLFRLREDELNRLIEEKKKEKLAALAQWAQKKKEEQVQRIADEFTEFMLRQDELKKKYSAEVNEIKAELDDYQNRRKAINEQLRREEELANERDYHRIILTSLDKDDIHYLISIEQNLHNKELLYKLIWSEYIQKPFNQMIKNVCGSNIPKNVIYCIENINTQKKYIGKTSAEVSKRWTEHVKSSLNIGGIKRQPVHDAMFGHWDEFTFSILEEVKDEKLGDREKYYISFFETDKYGYNLKGGG